MEGDDNVGTYYEYDKELIRRLRDYMYEYDMTSAEFAESVGCSYSVIAKFVSKNYKLGRNVKRKIARKIGMDEEQEHDLYNYKYLSNKDRKECVSESIDVVMSKIEERLNVCKTELYKLEYTRDQLHNLLKGL